ncbi:group 1 family glycosyl transferase [Burkholderia lata]|uniref:glycosyltransferase family 4 protein n=1 Tax=Burkholderia lata (strain ATCC 17760 / DSM 23089 / LMG 22485 / NCIMB 9086 / R18194 / 383) TaxID=482957 RepID=UPI001453122F|nr:glycosyltransferase family 1 protein [Burkholderia lata]VWD15378.1 group 1 family glycosyl transferase [Burkholderia lata]
MKIAFCVDAITPPLTGIGRYTYELANHYLADSSNFAELKFFLQNRWIENPNVLLSNLVQTRHRKGVLAQTARKFRRWRLNRQARQFLFHSPNYFLPDLADSGISTIHDLSVFRYPEAHPRERLADFENRFDSTLNRAQHLVTDSEATRKEVIDYFGWPDHRVTSIPLGVATDFHPRDNSDLQNYLGSTGLRFGSYSLCVSTLEPRKRIDYLLDAYSSLPDDVRRHYPLVLAGSKGWLSDALHSRIETYQRDGWLRYLGFVPESALPLLYSGARAFLYPSIYEGFGLPVLEALASGIPTLTSNRSSLPEVAGGAAWLVDPDDTEALKQGIAKILLDDEWRRTAVSAGLSVASRFTWKRCADRTIELYRQISQE